MGSAHESIRHVNRTVAGRSLKHTGVVINVYVRNPDRTNARMAKLSQCLLDRIRRDEERVVIERKNDLVSREFDAAVALKCRCLRLAQP